MSTLYLALRESAGLLLVELTLWKILLIMKIGSLGYISVLAIAIFMYKFAQQATLVKENHSTILLVTHDIQNLLFTYLYLLLIKY